MSLKPSPAELEPLRAEDERLAEEDRERARQREAEGEAIRAARERWLREHGGEDVMGVPMSRIRVDR